MHVVPLLDLTKQKWSHDEFPNLLFFVCPFDMHRLQSMESHHLQNSNKKDVSFTIFLLDLQQLLDYENWQCSEYTLTLSVNSKISISDYNFRIFCIFDVLSFSVFDKPFHIFTYICMYMYEYVKLYMSMTAIFLKVQIQLAFSAFLYWKR